MGRGGWGVGAFVNTTHTYTHTHMATQLPSMPSVRYVLVLLSEPCGWVWLLQCACVRVSLRGQE